jgi:signal transduction histidine kinase
LDNNIKFGNNSYFNITNNQSICKSSILSNKIETIDIGILSSHDDNDFIFSFRNVKKILYIPINYLSEVIGILGIVFNKSDVMIDTDLIKCISNYLSIIQSSYSILKMSQLEVDKRFANYQLTAEILNTITSGIIVTDKDFKIVYINDVSIGIIKNIYSSYGNETNVIKIFPQLESMCDSKETIFRKRKLNVDIKEKVNITSLQFIIDTIMCNDTYHHVININNRCNNNDSPNTSIQTKLESFKTNKNLIGYLSHELRNPLQTINLANHLIQTNIKKAENIIPIKVITNLNTINKACHDMKKIVNDILDLSKLEAREFVIDIEIVNINDMISDIVEDYIETASNKNLILDYFINDDVPKTLLTDYTRCKQILGNLINNSIKYSDSGSILLETKYDDVNHGVLFTINDQGMGIREEELGNLFKEFGQTSNSFKINNDSNGLGLYISQKIANLLGGYIKVKSIYKEGSAFTLYHPIKLGSSITLFNYDIIENIICGKILLVDDNEPNLLLFKMLLESFNIEHNFDLHVDCVNDGQDAINICKINKYDLIFMDINMNGINGCMASKLIKLDDYDCPIIATTGNILAKKENRTGSDSQYNYFDEVIIKPFDNEIVLNALKKFIKLK